MTVAGDEDRAAGSLSNGQVDGAGGAWSGENGDGLATLADDNEPLAFYTGSYTVEAMSVLNTPTRVLSVTEASSRGVAGLLRDSERGADTVVERHGRPVGAVVSIQHFSELRELEQDLKSAALVLSRAATDNGHRTDLDDIIAAFGFTREELQRRRRDDAAAGIE